MLSLDPGRHHPWKNSTFYTGVFMTALYYYLSMVGFALVALIFREYIIILILMAVAAGILTYYQKKGWRKREFTVILYDNEMTELIRIPKVKAWNRKEAYYQVMGKKKHDLWDTEETTAWMKKPMQKKQVP